MTNSDASPAEKHSNKSKMILVVLLAIALLAFTWIMYSRTTTSEAPAQSTTESRPNNPRNIPDEGDGSVTEGSNPADATTPDQLHVRKF